ncbi:MAG: molybdate ABC transporter permease subunit [Anaerolineales bacterium]|nr:molybdate ABC transporter permease subunit [Anaerolineales bacterium]
MTFEASQSQAAAAERADGEPRRLNPLPPGFALLSLLLLLFLALPLAALLLRASPNSVATNLAQPQVRQAIALSARTTAVSTILIVVLGTPLAYVVARRRFPGRRALDTLVELPMVLPPSVAGLALLMAFGRRGLVGQWLAPLGLSLAFTEAAVVLAQMFIAAPLFVKAAMGGFAAIDDELEQAAAMDGASRWQTFRHITLPLAQTALLSGTVLAWARALGEFGATIIFAGNFPGRTQTMPLAIYLGFEIDLGVALTLAVILIASSFLVLILVKLVLHRDPALGRWA